MNRAIWFHILHDPSPHNKYARLINYFLALTILVNCLAVAIETVPSIQDRWKTEFFFIEAASMMLFLIEYLLRLWVCVEQTRFSRSVTGRLRYMVQPFPVLDLLVLATYFAPVDLRFLRIFRILRILRVLNLDSLDDSLRVLLQAIRRRRDILITSILIMLIATYALAAAIFQLEHQAQPDKFTSIPETLWWAIITLTTIGYGDLSPVTSLGKTITGILIIFGIGIFALPTAIITAAILDAGQRQEKSNCPHCGNSLD